MAFVVKRAGSVAHESQIKDFIAEKVIIFFFFFFSHILRYAHSLDVILICFKLYIKEPRLPKAICID